MKKKGNLITDEPIVWILGICVFVLIVFLFYQADIYSYIRNLPAPHSEKTDEVVDYSSEEYKDKSGEGKICPLEKTFGKINYVDGEYYHVCAVEGEEIIFDPIGYDPDDDELIYDYSGWKQEWDDVWTSGSGGVEHQETRTLLTPILTGSSMYRDTKRKAELKQYQDALEIYASANDGFYPFRRGSAQHGHVLADTVCQDIQASVELPNCPDDPTQTKAVDRYRYQSNGSAPGGGPTATRFVIRASLERDDEWFIICSDGRSGEVDKTVLFDGSGSCPL